MTATAQNFAFYQGETKTLEVLVTDGDNENAPFSLTNVIEIDWGAWVDINTRILTKKLTLGAPDNIVRFSSAGTDDALRMNFTVTDTQILNGDYYHECRIIDSSGNQDVIFIGTMTIGDSRTVQPSMLGSETITVTEAVTVSVQATSTPSISVSDSVTVTEAVTLMIESYIVVSDGVSVAELIELILVSLANVSESITLAEEVTVAIE